jgi:Uma2 family endonuclease
MSTVARFTIDEYDKMIESGAFEQDRRFELIRGELRKMSPIGVPHAYAVEELAEWSYANAPLAKVQLRSQNPINIPGLQSVPEPDHAWLKRRDYSRQHPTADEVLLIVEAADSSLPYDRGEKSALYAEVGIADYWIVNIPDRCIEVRRQPVGKSFEDIRIYRESETVSPLHFSDLALPVASLFSAAR